MEHKKKHMHHKSHASCHHCKMHHMKHHMKHKDMQTKEDHAERREHKEKKTNFIAGAIKHPGALRKELHVKKGHKIPAAKLKKASHAKGKEGQRARLAITLGKLRKKK
jgi:hypothetical protein